MQILCNFPTYLPKNQKKTRFSAIVAYASSFFMARDSFTFKAYIVDMNGPSFRIKGTEKLMKERNSLFSGKTVQFSMAIYNKQTLELLQF